MRNDLISIFCGLLLAGLAACTPLAPEAPGEDRPLVEVGLSLAVAPVEDGTAGAAPATKADHEAAGGSSVKTVAVLQFEWRDDDPAHAQLINQQFLRASAIGNAPLALPNTKNTIVAVANVPGKLPLLPGLRFGEFLDNYNYSLIAAPDDPVAGVWYSPDPTASDPDRYLRLSGSTVVDEVSATTPIAISLKRNCAKIVVKVRNSSSGEGAVTLDRVQLCSVNQKYQYLAKLPADLSPLTVVDTYSAEYPFRIDTDLAAFSDGEAGTGADAGWTLFTYYVPANPRGSSSQVGADQWKKNWHAPAGATYFCIDAHYGAGTPITYSYYLGANLTSDYNLEANKAYTFRFDIADAGKDKVSSDARIDDLSEVKMRVDANCYMVQPPARPGQSRVYSFAVRRAEIFWNKAGTGMGEYGAAVDITGTLQDVYALDGQTEWTAEVVWADIDNYTSDDDFLLTPGGTGFVPDFDSGAGCIKVKVSSGMRGSALVAIRKKTAPTENDILWSWHIWVTDYAPDVAMEPEAGTYVYPVPGGDLHRYNNAYFNTGAARNAFMMDRNLGARAALGTGNGIGVNDSFGFHYYWGRKDPFRALSPAVSNANTDEGLGAPYWTIRYTVHNPTKLVYASSATNPFWTKTGTGGDDMGDYKKAWLDPKLDGHSLESDFCEAGKSIYDPCPPGWQVCTDSPVDGFNGTSYAKNTIRRGFFYYPGGSADAASAGAIFFPNEVYVGNMSTTNNNVTSAGSYLASYEYARGSIQFQDTKAMRSGYIGQTTSVGTLLGSVRCMKMNP